MTLLAHALAPALALAFAPSTPGLADPGDEPAAMDSAAAAARRRTPIRGRPGRAPAAEVAAANRTALHEPRQDGFVGSVQIYPWSEGGIYQLYTAPGHITDIALQPGEALTAVAAGDTARWVVGDTTSGSGPSRQVHILLKPTAAGLRTNLVITTDRRIYRIEAEAGARAAMAAVAWTYPGDALLALSGAGEGMPAGNASTTGEAALFDFDYRITGDKPSWRPVRVFNDGRQVFIEMPPGLAQDRAPPLFARAPDGSSELLNYRLRGGFYVVDRLFDAAELRLGGKKQQVVRIEHRKGTRR